MTLIKQAILALLLLVTGAFMGIWLQAVANSQRIQICDDDDWPLFTSDALGQRGKGISFDIVNALFSDIKENHEFKPIPWRRCLNRLREGSSDAALLLSVNSERLKYLEFSDPILSELGEVYYRKEHNKLQSWRNMEDFRGMRIGLMGGYNYAGLFDESQDEYELSVTVVTTNEQGLEMLSKNRLDAFFTARSIGRTLLRKQFPDGHNIAIADKPYFRYIYHMGFSKQSPEVTALIPEINASIRKLKAEGTIDNIINKHYAKAWGEVPEGMFTIEE